MTIDYKRVDPTDCGCTDCMTGYSKPFAWYDTEQVRALLDGTVQDATYGGWKHSDKVKDLLHEEWLAGRVYTAAEAADKLQAALSKSGQWIPAALLDVIAEMRSGLDRRDD